jgi:hypothetical protein
MIILGYLAMLMLGLLPLAAFARMAGVEAERTFFLPTEFALVVAFLIGVGVCLGVGRVLGVLRFAHLDSYEQRIEGGSPSGTIRRERRRRRRATRGAR